MRKGRLTRIEETDRSGRIRAPIEGTYPNPPTVGRSFAIVNDEPLDNLLATNRLVYTSVVVEVDGNEFVTESGSRYRLEEL